MQLTDEKASQLQPAGYGNHSSRYSKAPYCGAAAEEITSEKVLGTPKAQ